MSTSTSASYLHLHSPPAAYPGLALAPSTPTSTPGPGTHLVTTPAGDAVYASSLAGRPHRSSAGTTSVSVSRPTTTTTGPRIPSRGVASSGAALPAVGDVVLGRVTRLERGGGRVQVAIAVAGGRVCADGFFGVVRREDVSRVLLDGGGDGEGLFRVGDVVRAVVVSLGDQAGGYYLSTARNDLGVLMATSEAGNDMYPVSWREFRDPVTGRSEARKVAKPV